MRAERLIESSWLGAFRLAFGLVMAVSMTRFLVYDWPERFFQEPKFFFKYSGFEWVEPLPGPLMQLLFGGLILAACAVALGVAFRAAALLLALGLSYFQLLDVTTYLNHYYLAALLAWLLALSPAGNSHTLSTWIRRHVTVAQPEPPVRVATGWLWLLRLQVGVVYFFAGIAKLQSDWLIHAQPLRIWLGANTELPVIGPLLTLEHTPLALSWAGFLFDTTIVLWLSLPRTRGFAFLSLVVFHVLTRVLFPIGMFPAIMIVSALVFFPPDWPKTAWARLTRRSKSAAPQLEEQIVTAAASPRRIRRLRRLGWAAAALYGALQVVVPLRFLAYDGNVLWHEQGMRFSWRVMVRAKGGSTTFTVSNPDDGRSWRVLPNAYLTPMQESEMASQPDLLIQLAHHIKRDFDSRGLGPVEVRALAKVSLNGRRSELLLDPHINLAQVNDDARLAQVILPAPQTSPPQTRLVP